MNMFKNPFLRATAKQSSAQLRWKIGLDCFTPFAKTAVFLSFTKWPKSSLGFFKKKSNPLAIQIVQSIVYGDLTKAEDLLKANPHLLRTLLTEKVTVKDYSRRKVKQTAKS